MNRQRNFKLRKQRKKCLKNSRCTKNETEEKILQSKKNRNRSKKLRKRTWNRSHEPKKRIKLNAAAKQAQTIKNAPNEKKLHSPEKLNAKFWNCAPDPQNRKKLMPPQGEPKSKKTLPSKKIAGLRKIKHKNFDSQDGLINITKLKATYETNTSSQTKRWWSSSGARSFQKWRIAFKLKSYEPFSTPNWLSIEETKHNKRRNTIVRTLKMFQKKWIKTPIAHNENALHFHVTFHQSQKNISQTLTLEVTVRRSFRFR